MTQTVDTIELRNIDKAKQQGGFCWQQNTLPKDYISLIGIEGVGLYAVYSSVAVKGIAKIEQQVLATAAQCGDHKISDTAKLMHIAGVIVQLPAPRGHLVRVALPHLPPLTASRLQTIKERVQAFPGYKRLCDKLLKRIENFKNLKQAKESVRSKHAKEKRDSQFFSLNGHSKTDYQTENLVWLEIKSRIQMEIPKAAFNNWIRGADANLDGDMLTIIAETIYSKDWIVNRLINVIQRIANDVMKCEVKIVVETKVKQMSEVSTGN